MMMTRPPTGEVSESHGNSREWSHIHMLEEKAAQLERGGRGGGRCGVMMATPEWGHDDYRPELTVGHWSIGAPAADPDGGICRLRGASLKRWLPNLISLLLWSSVNLPTSRLCALLGQRGRDRRCSCGFWLSAAVGGRHTHHVSDSRLSFGTGAPSSLTSPHLLLLLFSLLVACPSLYSGSSHIFLVLPTAPSLALLLLHSGAPYSDSRTWDCKAIVL